MKVLMIARSTLHSGNGGDTTQVLQTANFLQKIGVQVDVKLSNESIVYADYDLIHFFNIIRPADILRHKDKSGLPFVVSTIYVDYSLYEKSERGVLFQLMNALIGKHRIEYLKVIARHIKGNEKLPSWDYILKGHFESIQEIIEQANWLLPNSQNEADRVLNDFKVKQHLSIIPNAIDKSVFKYLENESREGVLCVGRIERRKNQLNLIKAINQTKYKLTLIGKPTPNQLDYYEECKIQAGDNVTFINSVTEEELVNNYQIHRVHVLASWFETTGLVSLEAAICGCNIVITEMGDTKEYFESYAKYCDPKSIKSIQEAIELAYNSESSNDFRKKILSQYTWEATAQKTKEVYSKILLDD